MKLKRTDNHIASRFYGNSYIRIVNDNPSLINFDYNMDELTYCNISQNLFETICSEFNIIFDKESWLKQLREISFAYDLFYICEKCEIEFNEDEVSIIKSSTKNYWICHNCSRVFYKYDEPEKWYSEWGLLYSC